MIRDRMRALLPLALLLLAVSGCSTTGGCENRVLESKADLEGPLVAYRFVRNCGATTDYSTHVAIGKHGEDPAEAQVVLTMDSSRGAADMEGDAVWSEMHWTGPHLLSVAYAKKARVFNALGQAAGATIEYRATSRAVFVPLVP